MNRIILFIVVLLIFIYTSIHIYCTYNFVENQNYKINSQSIDYLCNFSLNHSVKYNHLKKFNLKIGEIEYRNFHNKNKMLDIILIGNDSLGFVCKLKYVYDITNCEFKYVECRLNDEHMGGSLYLDYSNWTVDFERVCTVFITSSIKDCDEPFIEYINGYYNYDYKQPVIVIKNQQQTVLFNPYNGKQLSNIKSSNS